VIFVYLFMYEQEGSEAFRYLERRQEIDEITPEFGHHVPIYIKFNYL